METIKLKPNQHHTPNHPICRDNSPRMVELVSDEGLLKISGDAFLNLIDDYKNSPAKELVHKILNLGATRQLKTLNPDFTTQLQNLADEFPNFNEVIHHIRLEFMKSNVLGYSEVVWQTPILLLGAPGVGKTHFANRLSTLLDVSCKKIDFSVTQAHFSLIGQDRGYADACEGEVFNLLTASEYANPIIFIDELDKCVGDSRYKPSNVLLTLLEKESARKFEDSFIRAPINASHINWIFTANDLSKIPREIQSRLLQFEIKAPTREQCKIIAQNIFSDMCKQYERFPKEHRTLSNDVLEVLAKINPRELRKLLSTALGQAVSNNRVEILPCDLLIKEHKTKRTSMGFYPVGSSTHSTLH